MSKQLFHSCRSCLSWMKGTYGTLPTLWHFFSGQLFRGGLVKLPVPGGSICIRPDTTDYHVIQEIFYEASYGVVKGRPQLIIDAGGHIGAATLYLAIRFPESKIVVIEPDERNFKLLERNTRRFRNVQRLRAGLWCDNSLLKINNPEDSPWAFNLSQGDGGIKGVTVLDVLAMSGESYVDLLKIDIEGSEVEVLNASEGWIDRVGMLMVELHDRFRAGCTDALNEAVAGRGFQSSTSGEYVVMTRVTAT